jgi:hypothetical protein
MKQAFACLLDAAASLNDEQRSPLRYGRARPFARMAERDSCEDSGMRSMCRVSFIVKWRK